MNHINVFESREHLGLSAGKLGAQTIRKAIAEKGHATVILATGMSQFDTLSQLVLEKEIDWSKITMFHLDEYIDLPAEHKASFRKYLQERFLNLVPALKKVVLIDGEVDPDLECQHLNEEIRGLSIDLAFVGIGENGHLAFNDPPADFTIEKAYHIVDLDLKCRQQQVNEGWFDSLDDVPRRAISMTIRQIMRSKTIICSVPGLQKAEAIRNCLTGEVTAIFPASILQTHPDCHYFLDKASASLFTHDNIIDGH